MIWSVDARHPLRLLFYQSPACHAKQCSLGANFWKESNESSLVSYLRWHLVLFFVMPSLRVGEENNLISRRTMPCTTIDWSITCAAHETMLFRHEFLKGFKWVWSHLLITMISCYFLVLNVLIFHAVLVSGGGNVKLTLKQIQFPLLTLAMK